MKLIFEKTIAGLSHSKRNLHHKLVKKPRTVKKISHLAYFIVALGFAIVLSFKLISAGSAQAEPDFTIIVMPDTQHYTDIPKNIVNFAAQTDWIVNNRVPLNIKFVTHLGDIVQNGDNFGDDSEWQIADAAMAILEDPTTTSLLDGIPYGVAPGNHDQGDTGDGTTGQTVFFNQFFGVSRFAGRAYYGGSFEPTRNDNNYELFSAGNFDFIIIHLEYDGSRPPAKIIWADNLLKTYSTRRAIVVSHFLIEPGNPGEFGGQGQLIYDELKDNPNLFLMLAGHRSGEGRREDTYNGNTVYTLLSNYQGRAGGGDGWLRIMEFSPSNNEIRVKTYSPVRDEFETDDDSQFTIPFSTEVNARPTVDAGQNQTIYIGGAANLDGTVDDDGIPDPPGALATNWSVEAIPQAGAQVQFANPNSVDTTATFTHLGDYVLRLTASDGILSAFDEVTITVNPNQLPTVYAGPDQTVNLPNGATLQGTVDDDGQPNPPGMVTTSWNKVSGPGFVSFANASAVNTTAYFTTPGDYILRLTAVDGEGSAEDDVLIKVKPIAQSNFTIWLPVLLSKPPNP
jgi:hypothetical protein